MLVVSMPTRRLRSRSAGRGRHRLETKRLLDSVNRWDAQTAVHCRRVADLATALARSMSLSSERIGLVRTAALLHDVGKITVPIAILRKRGVLTRSERRILSRHARSGEAILRTRLPGGELAAGVRFHHLHFNGAHEDDTRIRGTGIPLVSRLLSVVDAYEAMTGNRDYRQSVSHERACEELVRNAGAQFDPAIVSAFLRTFRTTRPER